MIILQICHQIFPDFFYKLNTVFVVFTFFLALKLFGFQFQGKYLHKNYQRSKSSRLSVYLYLEIQFENSYYSLIVRVSTLRLSPQKKKIEILFLNCFPWKLIFNFRTQLWSPRFWVLFYIQNFYFNYIFISLYKHRGQPKLDSAYRH